MTTGEPSQGPRNIDPFGDPGDGESRPPHREGVKPSQPQRPPAPRRPPWEDHGSANPRAGHAADDGRHGTAMGFFRELPVLLLIAFGLAFLLRTFVIQVFYIPSSSMEDTLEINDRIVVEKLTYHFREPRRGEIVVFEGDEGTVPENGAISRVVRSVGQFIGIVPVNAQDFVKRVIGVPGDHIEITDGTVFVNGVPLDEPYVEFTDARSSGPFHVPEGHLFVLGDNRPNSSDSRFGLGFVEIDDVVGRAIVTIWPFDRASTIDGPDYGAIPSGDDAPATEESATEDG